MKNQKKKSKPVAGIIINYAFFICLALSIVLPFIEIDRSLYKNPLVKPRIAIALLTIITGIFYVYRNRKGINAIMDDDAAGKTEDSQSGQLKTLQNRRLHFIGLLLVVGFSVLIFSYKLGNFDFWTDEYQVVSTATGYYHTGKFYKWSYLNSRLTETPYPRAWPHTWLIAQSYKLFGISEWSSRIVSVSFGVLFIFLSYFVARYFICNRSIALLISTILMLYARYVDLFRWTRMYALLLPLFMLLAYALFRALTEQSRFNITNNASTKIIRKYLNFNYLFVLLSITLLLINYLIHLNALIILPVIVIFSLLLAITEREKKYFVVFFVFLLAVPIIATYAPLTKNAGIYRALTFFETNNIIYLRYLFAYPFGAATGLCIFILGGCLLIFARNKPLRIRMAYFYCISLFSFIFFACLAKRYPGFKYISHCSVFAVMLITYIFIMLCRSSRSKTVIIIFTVLLLSRVGFGFYKKFDDLYVRHPLYGRPSVAYKTLMERYDPDRDVIIMGPYFRSYYYDSGKKPITKHLDLPYDFKKFTRIIKSEKRGWITWETSYSYMVNRKIIKFANRYFKKYHGFGADDTRIELYYFNLMAAVPGTAGIQNR